MKTHTNAIVHKLLAKQEELNMPRAAFFTDIDKTFRLPDGELERESRLIAAGCHQLALPLCAVSGVSFHSDSRDTRGIASLEQRIRAGELPLFPVVISDVGTARYLLSEDEDSGQHYYKKDTDYELQLRESGYERKWILQNFQKLTTTRNRELQQAQLQLQSPELEQEFIIHGRTNQPYKVSGYFFAGTHSARESVAQYVATAFPKQRIVVCEEMHHNKRRTSSSEPRKYCLDILPLTKSEAVADMSNKLRLDLRAVAGDSGNDLHMLFSERFPQINRDKQPLLEVAVVVGGAEAQVTRLTEEVFADSANNIKSSSLSEAWFQMAIGADRYKFYYRELGERRGPQSLTKATIDFLGYMRRAYPPASYEPLATHIAKALAVLEGDKSFSALTKQIYQNYETVG